ncbi:LPXTG cell wall anchor domain-containing protein [Paractinoplanes rishiriensis]|uniref:Gram-positive cocci surface proteins LPxTG domain-containing protein n=1 Tax=Paractinoplanes rishiriensis TaxID=1050105 RepID=A0A919JUC8_9ACTN|nr:LPXTG cell wall anchor domain-containing protein [Actinoplanes rishiriensis]GIE93689.1 hypothetical protein Ari01nite_11540 [Actinoplanes rishiriensis]
MRNPLSRAAAILVAALLSVGGVATSAHATGNGGHGGGKRCTPVERAEYRSHLDGPAGTATIVLLNGPLCANQDFALVSYTAPSAKFALPQYVMDSSVKSFEPPAQASKLTRAKLEFKVEVPTCFTQVDLVRGSRIINPLVSEKDLYGDRKLEWYNGGKGTCEAKPAVEDLSDCTGNVKLKLINRQGSNLAAEFKVTGDAGFDKSVSVARNAIADLDVPAANAKSIVVTANGKEIWRGGWTKPKDCQEPEVGKPDASLVSTCDGLVFTIKNPANGVPVTVTLTPNKGEAQTVTVQPGQSPAPITFPGQDGLTVTVSGDLDAQNGVITWTKPEDCVNPSPSPSDSGSPSPSASTSVPTTPATPTTSPVAGGGGGELPLTGAAAGTVAGGAALLLIIGGVLFFLARRRRVNFTA